MCAAQRECVLAHKEMNMLALGNCIFNQEHARALARRGEMMAFAATALKVYMRLFPGSRPI